jgi:ATP-dependent Clp protease ATP-binding subunit ClpA
MFERFSTEARAAVIGAQDQARTFGHRYIGTEHLLLSLLANDDGTSALLRERGVTIDVARAAIEQYVQRPPEGLTPSDAEALRTIGIDLDEVRRRLEENFGPDPLARQPEEPVRRRFGLRRSRRAPEPAGARAGHVPFSARAKKVLELSLREALRLKHRSIGTEHILLGLIREGEGLAAMILTRHKVDMGELRRAVEARFRTAA